MSGGEAQMDGEADDFIIDEDGNLYPLDACEDEGDEEEDLGESILTFLVFTDEMVMYFFRVSKAEAPLLQKAIKELMTTLLTPQ